MALDVFMKCCFLEHRPPPFQNYDYISIFYIFMFCTYMYISYFVYNPFCLGN